MAEYTEINAIKQAEKARGKGSLSGCALYTSAEPCSMCAAAIAWSGIDTVIFSVPIEALTVAGMNQIDVKCSEVFYKTGRKIALHGPLMVKEGLRVFSNSE